MGEWNNNLLIRKKFLKNWGNYGSSLLQYVTKLLLAGTNIKITETLSNQYL